LHWVVLGQLVMVCVRLCLVGSHSLTLGCLKLGCVGLCLGSHSSVSEELASRCWGERRKETVGSAVVQKLLRYQVASAD